MWINKFVFLFSIVCIIVVGTAQMFPLQPITREHLTNCWSSLEVIPDCVPEIFRSILNGQIGNVGLSCCHVFLGLNVDCIPHMFAFTPFFPPILSDHCSRK
ncbi:hypothetical protein AALP_AA8G192300 [Arabis alpina]|uniref:Prolamin-like domain-containing protein n=1 Tax=Arabis alpina TaxID=50452 RepID=A0A087G815_ARAAL|nr:hypothetical protein AALP_AA8G192300 [Arabis alpina]